MSMPPQPQKGGKNSRAPPAVVGIVSVTVSLTRDELRDAILIHNQSLAAMKNFYALYRALRDGSKGTSTHDEQDLLRAMLVFACSGLDAVVKQLVEDSLEAVVKNDKGADNEFQKFVERRLRKAGIGDERERNSSNAPTIDVALISQLLISESPKNKMIALLKANLTADSLQSRDQLLKVAAHFALTKDQIMRDEATTLAVFKARNEIIHEMDVDLSGLKKRRQRAHKEMLRLSENMLSVSAMFINAVAAKL